MFPYFADKKWKILSIKWPYSFSLLSAGVYRTLDAWQMLKFHIVFSFLDCGSQKTNKNWDFFSFLHNFDSFFYSNPRLFWYLILSEGSGTSTIEKKNLNSLNNAIYSQRVKKLKIRKKIIIKWFHKNWTKPIGI